MEFVKKLKTLVLSPDERFFSYDAEALFPSVPINDCLDVLTKEFEEDVTLKDRTSLTPSDLRELLDLCLSSTNFVFDGRHHTTKDSGPIGLSLMVTISQKWMTHTMDCAVALARQRQIQLPKNLYIYMDDCFCSLVQRPNPRRPGLRSATRLAQSDPAAAFNDCLNEVHPRVKFTRETENDGCIAFLDVHVTRLDNGRVATCVYRKPSNTNIIIKPQSCQPPQIAISSFKGELCRAHRLCSTPALLKGEIHNVLNIFEDNGHHRQSLTAIAECYSPPGDTSSPASSEPLLLPPTSTDQTDNPGLPPTSVPLTEEQTVASLFAVLAHDETEAYALEQHDDDDTTPMTQGLTTDELAELQRRPTVCLPYIPELSSRLKRVLNRAGCKTYFKSGSKLSSVLCSKNKTRPPKQDMKGVYRLDCPCSPSAVYVGETARKFSTRVKEHRKAVEHKKWSHSGITAHKEACDLPVDWENPQILATMAHKNKKVLKYNLRLREALQIQKNDCGPGRGLNEDWGAYLKTRAWVPVFNRMK